MTRDERMNKFLEAWNKLMKITEDIKEKDNFKFHFEVTISTLEEDTADRVKLIEGINQSFRDRGWRYSTEY